MTELEAAIERHRNFAVSQSYTMSIGELMSLYRDGELILHPEYQRAYRWGDSHKNAFIESILLGIPLPTIFVAQTPSGKWDIVDGLQRLATIFEFAGIYKDVANEKVSPLVLKATYELPELEGVRFVGDNDDDEDALSAAMRIEFRRARMTVVVLMPESFETARLELFIRLNTLGSPLKQQDVRDVVMIATDSAFFTWFDELSNDEMFVNTTDLPSFEKRSLGHELVQRILALSPIDSETLEQIPDLDAWLNFRTRNLPEDIVQDEAEERFRKAFRLLHSATGKETFQIEGGADGAGPFAIGLFDEIALGLYTYIDRYHDEEVEDVRAVVAGLRASFDPGRTFASCIRLGRDAFRRA